VQRTWVRFVLTAALVASCTSQGVPSAPRVTEAPPETVAPTATAPSVPPTEAPPVETDPTVTAPPQVTPEPTAAPTPPNPFGRRDTPPGGVAAQLGFFIPNLFGCARVYADIGPGQFVRTAEALEVPGRTRICLLGFAIDEPLDVSVTAPDGSGFTLPPTIDFDGSLVAWLTRLPDDPFGTYAVHAQQGRLAADTSLEVVAPRSPLGVVVPDPVHAGDAIQIWLGGLEPRSQTPAYLYRLERGAWQFIADLGAVSIDDGGFGMIALSSQSSDPTGEYRVEAGTTVRFSLLP
jgi:hypothetical protein